MRAEQLAGSEALAALTTLLQRSRAADPTWGSLEAADVQWWWRFDQRPDPLDCTVWFDDQSQPTIAVSAVNFKDGMLADIIRMPHAEIPDEAIDAARIVTARHADRDISCSCPTEDHELAHVYRTIGAHHTDESMIATWIAAPALRPAPDLPDGYALRTRADSADDRDHHMIGRSGPEVEQRLHETSLYRADLDLWIETADGDCAGYALFWADAVTKVGLVEPMRVEEAHQNRGLARFLLLAGAHRLAGAGCERVKVCYMEDNPIARRTYLGGGFRPMTTIETFAVRR